MKVIHSVCWDEIKPQIANQIDATTSATTDGCSSYNKSASMVSSHHGQVVSKSEIAKLLSWVHFAISNAKRLLLDVHHRIDDDFLQSYLNEFCFKFNRRYFGEKLFDRLLVASVSYRWDYLGAVSG